MKTWYANLFHYTFKNKASTWYFNLLVGSINDWDYFEKELIDTFGEVSTPSALLK